MLHAQGGNYSIEVEQGVVHCRVWKRPDITLEEGARFAAQKLEHLWRLAAKPHDEVRAFVFDLRGAPESWGPATNESLGTAVQAFRMALKRIAIVVSSAPVQYELAEKLATEFGGRYSRVFGDYGAGVRWAGDKSAPVGGAKGRAGVTS